MRVLKKNRKRSELGQRIRRKIQRKDTKMEENPRKDNSWGRKRHQEKKEEREIIVTRGWNGSCDDPIIGNKCEKQREKMNREG